MGATRESVSLLLAWVSKSSMRKSLLHTYFSNFCLCHVYKDLFSQSRSHGQPRCKRWEETCDHFRESIRVYVLLVHVLVSGTEEHRTALLL